MTASRAKPNRTPFIAFADTLGVALVELCDGVERMLFREDLEAAGLDVVEAYLDACMRLHRVVRARLVHAVVTPGPWGVPCLSFHHGFLAASCLVLPDLFERAARALGCESLIAATPRRDALLVAPDLGAPFRLALRDVMRRPHETASAAIFRVEPSGPRILHDFVKSALHAHPGEPALAHREGARSA
ncbi:MAG: hypothetical protein KF819_01870 [Labilithrix sp.]|nr:hypothetical protein [Labilithrix sp.]